jgi:hypothetical protein
MPLFLFVFNLFFDIMIASLTVLMEDYMHRLKFKSKEFARMIDWMTEHKRKIPYVDETTEDYGLWLVKDDGIYVMSPSAERDTDGDGVHVIYANGFHRDEEDIWDKTHAVSGDDFAEFIPLDWEQVKRVKTLGELEIGISATQLEIRA